MFLITLAMFIVGELSAQQGEERIIGGDTLVVNYTPIDNSILGGGGRQNRFFKWIENYATAEPRDVGHGVGFSIIGGPAYSSTTSLRLAVIGSMEYRTPRMSLQVQPSRLELSATASITGFYRVTIDGSNFLGTGRHRLFYRIDTSSTPTKIWGLTFEQSSAEKCGKYTAKHHYAWLRYNYAIARNTYIGLYADYHYLGSVKLDDYASMILDGHAKVVSTAGIGANFAYDSRDVITGPQRGIYAGVEFVVRPRFINDTGHNLWQAVVVFDAYQPLWRGATLAYDLYGEFHSEATPWMLRAQLGDDYRMRGYYLGRYNGNNLISTQLELRQRIWNRLGCVAWGGAGLLLSEGETVDWSRVLPSYGVGLRWEFRRRSNLRIDFGFGRNTFGVVVGVNEAF